MFRNSVSGIGEAWMLDSNGYNSGSERVEEDLSGLLVGASGVAGVWMPSGESIVLFKAELGRGCCVVVVWWSFWWLFGGRLVVVWWLFDWLVIWIVPMIGEVLVWF
jgi:hypothetical protein